MTSSELDVLTRMLQGGHPEEVADFVIAWHSDPPAAAYTVVPTVKETTGRDARTLAEWTAEHAEVFRS